MVPTNRVNGPHGRVSGLHHIGQFTPAAWGALMLSILRAVTWRVERSDTGGENARSASPLCDVVSGCGAEPVLWVICKLTRSPTRPASPRSETLHLIHQVRKRSLVLASGPSCSQRLRGAVCKLGIFTSCSPPLTGDRAGTGALKSPPQSHHTHKTTTHHAVCTRAGWVG